MSRVTLVILTYNRVREALGTVERSLALPERPSVIVVDNGSTDGSAECIARRFPAVRVLRLPHNGGAAGRNAGVERAGTPYVAFSDDDTVWAPGSLMRAVELLECCPRLAVVTARLLVGPEGREDPVSALMSASPLPSEGLPGTALLGFLAGASVFRRRAFVEAGGYEPRLFIGGEERLLAYELACRGWAMIYAAEVLAHHYPSAARDAAARARLLARNALWIAWLRRSLPAALRQTLRTPWPALLDALRGAPWVLRHRRRLPAPIEAMCEQVE